MTEAAPPVALAAADDDFDAEALTAALSAAPPAGLAERVFAATTPHLRARSRARRLRRLALLCGGFALAFAVGRGTAAPGAGERRGESAIAITPPADAASGAEAESAVVDAPLAEAVARESADAAATAAAAKELETAPPERLERLATRSEGPLRAALYRVAGDRYLAERSDVDAALRCYRAHLRAAGRAERRVGDHDHWLLAALKAEAE